MQTQEIQIRRCVMEQLQARYNQCKKLWEKENASRHYFEAAMLGGELSGLAAAMEIVAGATDVKEASE